MAVAIAACPRKSFGRTQAIIARPTGWTGASRRVHWCRPHAATTNNQRLSQAITARSSNRNRQVLEISKEVGAKSAEDDGFSADKNDEAEQELLASGGPNAATAAVSAAVFALVAFDVNSPISLHLLTEIDVAAHSWVAANVPQGFQVNVGEYVISDAAVAAACIGWASVCFQLLQRRSVSGLSRFGVGLTLMILGGGGSLVTGDPPIVHGLKEAFHRARPSNLIHHSYSFPSGHTSAAVVATGFLLFALLPAVATDNTRDDERGDVVTKGNGARRMLSVEKRMALWAAAGLVTAAGRVLADAHWVSDTIAGASLGVFLVSIGCVATTQVERRLSK